VHADPKSSGDLPDEPIARLVILGSEYPHRRQNAGIKAVEYAEEILNKAYKEQRHWVACACPESRRVEALVTSFACKHQPGVA
jgi:hypothetical protein